MNVRVADERPYISLKGDELEALYKIFLNDLKVLEVLSFELKHRKSSTISILKGLVDERLTEIKNNPHLGRRSTSTGYCEPQRCMESKDRVDKINKSSLSLNKFTSFSDVVRNISHSPKPESLIDDEIWGMFTKSLIKSDLKYRKIQEAATSLGLIWPITKEDDEIKDYINLTFDQIKKDYGFEQKRAIICAVAIASYTNVKSWRVLKDKYGEKDKAAFVDMECGKVSIIRKAAVGKSVAADIESSPGDRVKNISSGKIDINSRSLFFNSLLEFEAPWDCIKKTTWDKWRENIDPERQMLVVADVAKKGQFQCGESLRGITIGELLNFEFEYLESFDRVDRRTVFYAVAFLGLGNNVPKDSAMCSSLKDKSVLAISSVEEDKPVAVVSAESNAIDEILGDFGL